MLAVERFSKTWESCFDLYERVSGKVSVVIIVISARFPCGSDCEAQSKRTMILFHFVNNIIPDFLCDYEVAPKYTDDRYTASRTIPGKLHRRMTTKFRLTDSLSTQINLLVGDVHVADRLVSEKSFLSFLDRNLLAVCESDDPLLRERRDVCLELRGMVGQQIRVDGVVERQSGNDRIGGRSESELVRRGECDCRESGCEND